MPWKKQVKSYQIVKEVNITLDKDCTLETLSAENPIKGFACENEDLNEFFRDEALDYQNQLLGETYFFRKNDTSEIVCVFTLSTDSLNLRNMPGSRKRVVKKGFPRPKQRESYPAILIGRLGVDNKFADNGIGRQLLDFIKSYCLITFANKCRYITVDSYNNEKPLAYYENNDFTYMFSTEDQEREYNKKKEGEELRTRFMYFDLMHWMNMIN